MHRRDDDDGANSTTGSRSTPPTATLTFISGRRLMTNERIAFDDVDGEKWRGEVMINDSCLKGDGGDSKLFPMMSGRKVMNDNCLAQATAARGDDDDHG